MDGLGRKQLDLEDLFQDMLLKCKSVRMLSKENNQHSIPFGERSPIFI